MTLDRMSLLDFFSGPGSITDMGDRYPVLDRQYQSNIRDLFVVGNIAGTPDIKAALNAGYDVAHTIAALPPAHRDGMCDYHVIIVGGGPAGVNCALELQKLGVPYLLLEKKRLFSTIVAFDDDLPLYYAVTGDRDVRGDLPFQDTTAEELLTLWRSIISPRNPNIHEGENVVDIRKRETFEVETDQRTYSTRYVVVAVGKLVLLKKLDIEEKTPVRVNKSTVEVTSTPTDFLKKIGLRFEREWDWRRYIALIIIFLLVATFYLTKKLSPDAIRLPDTTPVIGGRNLAGLYPLLYTLVVTIFGTQALFRWKRLNPFDTIQRKKYLSLMFFQVVFFCLLPEFILRNWKAYGLVYAWPLALGPTTVPDFVHDWGKIDPYHFYFYWTLFMSFVLLPVVVAFTGKQYCSWVCGCGGLAETLGDRWRHYAPKGPTNIRRERQIFYLFGVTAIVTLLIGLGWDLKVHVSGSFHIERTNYGGLLHTLYGWMMDTFMIGIIPVALYPFLGGKVWCRYWCPTAGMMHLLSGWFRKRHVGYYRIESKKERCIACNMCTRYCEVGIDVRKFALKGETLDNINSSCIGCGICITVCPTETLSFGNVNVGARHAVPLLQIESLRF